MNNEAASPYESASLYEAGFNNFGNEKREKLDASPCICLCVCKKNQKNSYQQLIISHSLEAATQFCVVFQKFVFGVEASFSGTGTKQKDERQLLTPAMNYTDFSLSSSFTNSSA